MNVIVTRHGSLLRHTRVHSTLQSVLCCVTASRSVERTRELSQERSLTARVTRSMYQCPHLAVNVGMT